MAKVKVGDLVRLNDVGLEVIGGLRSAKEIDAQRKGFRVVDISEPLNIAGHYAVEVEGPLGIYLMTDDCVEFV